MSLFAAEVKAPVHEELTLFAVDACVEVDEHEDEYEHVDAHAGAHSGEMELAMSASEATFESDMADVASQDDEEYVAMKGG